MAKTIKFNLNCDGKAIRTIDDLRDNFSIEDVLSYYKEGLLSRWLEVRGYDDILKEVNSLTCETDIDITKALIRIFEVEINEKEIEKAIYILEFRDKQRALNEQYASEKIGKDEVIQEYHKGYDAVIRKIIANPKDIAVVRAAVQDIDDNYRDLFDLDYRSLFVILYNYAPMALFEMVTHQYFRDKYLVSSMPETDSTFTEADKNIQRSFYKDKNVIYEALCNLVRNKADMIEIMGDNIHIAISDNPKAYKPLQPSGVRCMVFSVSSGDKVGPYNIIGNELSLGDVNGQFVILDGLQYLANTSSSEIMYMEVGNEKGLG